MDNRPTAVDIFCGAGGLSQGLADAGFDILWAIDRDPKAVKTYRANHGPHAITQDITEFSLEDGSLDIDPKTDEIDPELFDIEPGELDLVAGGPPCPTFSIVGRSKINSFEDTTLESDERHQLYQHYLRIINYYQPQAFVMENVEGMMSAENEEGEPVIDVIIGEINQLDADYDVTVQLVDAADFGVPQHRNRVFFIGNRVGAENPDLSDWETHREPIRDREKDMKIRREPDAFKSSAQATISRWSETDSGRFSSDFAEKPDQKQPWVTVADAILDLPPVSPEGEMPPTEATEYTIDPVSEYQKWARDIDEEQDSEGQPLHNHNCRGHNMLDLTLYKLLGEGVGWSIDDVSQDLHPYRKDIFADKYKKQNPREPASTIVAHIQKDGHMFIHPREARSLTVREAARLQSFQDSYRFPISRTSAFRVVGNAVPPRLAKVIGTAIRKEVL